MIKRLPNWLMHRARWLAMAWVTLALSITAMQPVQAQISQTPLLTQSGSVEPNLVLMFDDSRSMYAQFLYQYGGDANGYGRTGPGVNAAQAAPGDCLISNGGMSCSTAPSGTASITVTNAYNPPQSTWYFEMSPDVNGVYYNPKVLYTPRVDATGTFSKYQVDCGGL